MTSPSTARPRHVALVGMMGTGKTTAGRALARRIERPFLDSDAEVSRRTGRSVAALFETKGEAGFRAMEAGVVADLLETSPPAVLALGGGAVLERASRDLLRSRALVVWLDASCDSLARRLGDGTGRPLLRSSGEDVAATLARLDEARRPINQELAEIVVEVDGVASDETARRVAQALLARVPVSLGTRSYEVLVGPGARHELASVLPERARRAVVVSQGAVLDRAGLRDRLATGIETTTLQIGEGERAKSLSTLESLCRGFARFGLTRDDVVIALGGGLVTDLAGFAAATYHRGTPVVHVATTLLAQVDAAIGGKTGVNLPEGKNLVGAFWQPRAVLCDTDLLATLPEREWRSGLGEMAKYAFIGVEGLDAIPLERQVAACVALKADVVAGDERESGRRAVLNYGHTLAHALEAAGFAELDAPVDEEGTGLRHGEAVAIGIVFAARLAERLGRIGATRVARHVAVVEGYGLSSEVPEAADADELITFMARDKKARDGLTFVLDGPSGVEIVEAVDPALVRSVLAEHRRGGART